ALRLLKSASQERRKSRPLRLSKCHSGTTRLQRTRSADRQRRRTPGQRALSSNPAHRLTITITSQRLKHTLRIFADSPQQRFGRPGRLASPLLPISQRPELHIDERGELGL